MECLIVRPEDVDLESSTLLLRDDEAHHAIKSLRLRVGDNLLASDLIGTCYQCKISAPPPAERSGVGGGWGVVFPDSQSCLNYSSIDKTRNRPKSYRWASTITL